MQCNCTRILTRDLVFVTEILTNRSYSIERTTARKNADGTESHVTCEIVTDHSVSHAIMTNYGQCFTAGKEEPSSGKMAMINRTVALFARTETDQASSKADFTSSLAEPTTAAKVDQFRLFTCLVAFTKLCMRKCPWLQPDLSYAMLMWTAGDDMLCKEYSQPKPEARRKERREENCRTLAIMEAVARIFCFKQTACDFQPGSPIEGTAIGKDFKIEDIWEIIRIASVPSRAVIRDAWIKSFPYSISTSQNGVNIMASIADRIGLGTENIFINPISGVSAQPNTLIKDAKLQKVPGSLWLHGKGDNSDGPKTEELLKFGEDLQKKRRLRNEWRNMAAKCETTGKSVIDVITQVAKGETPERIKEFCDALMPDFVQVCAYYKTQSVLQWTIGEDLADCKVNASDIHQEHQAFKQLGESREGETGPARYDYGWIVLEKANPNSFQELNFSRLVSNLKGQNNSPVGAMEYHIAGIHDTLLMLASPEAERPCPIMPKTRSDEAPHRAFVTELHGSNQSGLKDGKAFLRDYNGFAAHEPGLDDDGEPAGWLDCRLEHSFYHPSRFPVQGPLDIITSRNRLPALQPHTSSSIVTSSPIRRIGSSGIECNAVVAYEHSCMMIEASIHCSKIPGLKGRQDRIHGAGPQAFKNDKAIAVGTHDDTITSVLPFSNDVVQIHWGNDHSSRYYLDTWEEDLEQVNEVIEDEDLGPLLEYEDLPQQPLGFNGYPTKTGEQLRWLGLNPEKEKSFADPLSMTSSVMSDGAVLTEEKQYDLLRNEVEISLGAQATRADLQIHKRKKEGRTHLWGCTSEDAYALSAWREHVVKSMTARGMTSGMETDTGLHCILDAETMLRCRLLERRAQKKGSPESKLKITMPTPKTYSGDEREAVRKAIEAASQSASAASSACASPVVGAVSRPGTAGPSSSTHIPAVARTTRPKREQMAPALGFSKKPRVATDESLDPIAAAASRSAAGEDFTEDYGDEPADLERQRNGASPTEDGGKDCRDDMEL